MSQSSFIAAALLAGFVLYLAANSRLSVYSAVLWGATTSPVVSPVSSGGGSSGGSSVASAVKTAAKVAQVVTTVS